MIYMYIGSLLIIAHMHLQSQASFYRFKIKYICYLIDYHMKMKHLWDMCNLKTSSDSCSKLSNKIKCSNQNIYFVQVT